MGKLAGYFHYFSVSHRDVVYGKTESRKLDFLDCRRFNLHSDDALQRTGNHLFAVSCFYDNGGNGLFRMAETGKEIIFKIILSHYIYFFIIFAPKIHWG